MAQAMHVQAARRAENVVVSACAALCNFTLDQAGQDAMMKVIDRNGLRHMSDGPYKRHEPVVSEARF
jgi:hypothetical protein